VHWVNGAILVVSVKRWNTPAVADAFNQKLKPYDGELMDKLRSLH